MSDQQTESRVKYIKHNGNPSCGGARLIPLLFCQQKQEVTYRKWQYAIHMKGRKSKLTQRPTGSLLSN